MSLAEITAEVGQLSAAELEMLHAAVQAEIAKKQANGDVDMSKYAGCTRGMMQFNPGWDDPEPLEQWNALRDDTPL